jgi:PhoH-like ATPase
MEFDKIFVLDTNVLLHDPQAIYKFQDNLVVIPMTVLEELDTFKKGQNENSRNSRQFSRYLDDLRCQGDISKGVELDRGGYLKIDMESKTNTEVLKDNKADNRILASACAHKEKNSGKKVVLISKDINMRIKANALGIEAEDYESDKVKFEEMYSGVLVHEVDSDIIDAMYTNREISVKNIEDLPELYPNQYVFLKCAFPKQKGIGRYDAEKEALIPLITDKNKEIWGIHPKNREQAIAIDLLLDDDIKLVSLVGKAGTGKTLLAVATGLLKSIGEQRYKKLIVSRPVYPLGKDIGFLPGDINEKLDPYMKPIIDNIEFLIGGKEGCSKASIKELFDQEFVSVEPLTYIRGRSIPKQFLIVDEAQNLTPHEIKTIISRAGEGTKIVLTGDCYQIDNPYVDACSNGLSHVVENMKDQKIAGHITLIKGERSELAEVASNVL